jgi:hypothetical protein
VNALRFDVAVPQDDAQLREVLASTPMDGHVQVSFRREPSYLDASVVEGPHRQTLVARDGERLAAIGCRSVRRRYVNGQPLPIGYLSGLRLRPQYRGSGLLGRGYRFLHELHRDGRTNLYLTTIAAGNEVATRLLTSARTWLPRYHAAGRYCTFAIPARRAPRDGQHGASDCEVRRADTADLPALLELLSNAGRRRQFFPCYEAEDFFHDQGTFRDLGAENIWLACRNGQLIGSLAAWDQRSFRQSVVEGYSGWLRQLRPFYNLWARLRRRPRLPAPHHPLPLITAAIPMVVDDERAVFRKLLGHLLAEIPRGTSKNADYVLLGLHERDALAPVARQLATQVYFTRLYYVCWHDGEQLREQLDDRVPYLELGCL